MKLGRLFSEGAVFQCGMRIPLWGYAAPGSVVRAEFAGVRAHTVASREGFFRMELPPVEAGGPYTLDVSDRTGARCVVGNILAGEVWIASGQSNMEFPLKDSPEQYEAFFREGNEYDRLRMFTVRRSASGATESEPQGEWRVANRENAANFSAVALWFADAVRRKRNIPVGVIASCWGGTYIQAWISRETLAGNPDSVSELSRYEAFLEKEFDWESYDPAFAEASSAPFEQLLERFSEKDSGNAGVAKGWALPEFDDSRWTSMTIPGDWIAAGVNGNGATWFRKEIELPAHWAGKTLELHTGGIDKHDITYFNGIEIGRTGKDFDASLWAEPRVYSIPADIVKPGKNTIAIRAYSFIYGGGIVGPAEWNYAALPGTEEKVCFAGSCKAAAESCISPFVLNPDPPAGPWSPNTPHILFDGMISPLIPCAMRGVLWYQGETNAHCRKDAEEYARLMQNLIADWRHRWGQGDFPFLMVELANYRTPSDYDPESVWAVLRASQHKAAAALPNVRIAHSSDLGESRSIHPKDKRSVGHRLARIALSDVYRCPEGMPNGPEVESVRADGPGLRISFRFADGLHAENGPAKGFYLAGCDGRFYSASARIEGSTVFAVSDRVSSPCSIRYSWADNPTGNLFNSAQLPMSPFEADLSGSSPDGIHDGCSNGNSSL